MPWTTINLITNYNPHGRAILPRNHNKRTKQLLAHVVNSVNLRMVQLEDANDVIRPRCHNGVDDQTNDTKDQAEYIEDSGNG